MANMRSVIFRGIKNSWGNTVFGGVSVEPARISAPRTANLDSRQIVFHLNGSDVAKLIRSGIPAIELANDPQFRASVTQVLTYFQNKSQEYTHA